MSILNFLGRLKRDTKGRYLGIDIGSDSIKVCEISLDKGTPKLEGFGRCKTFPNVIINSIINDEKLLKTNLSNLFNNLKPQSKKINYALPYELTFYDIFQVQDPDNLEEIKREIDRAIPYKIEDVYFSYFVVPEEKGYEVYFLASRKEHLDKIQNIFQALNCSLENIDGDFVNLHNALEFLYGEENKLVIDWGNEKIKIFLYDKKVKVYVREIFNLGFKFFKTKLKKELNLIKEEDLEKIVINPLEHPEWKNIKSFYKNYIEEVVDEINVSLELAESKYNLKPEVCYLIGGGALIPNIHNIFTDLLKIEIRKINIDSKIKISEDMDPNYVDIISTQGFLALVTAIKGLI